MSFLKLVKKKEVTFSKSFENTKSINDQPTRGVDVVDMFPRMQIWSAVGIN